MPDAGTFDAALSVREAAQQLDLPRSELLALIEHCTDRPRTWWVARDTSPLQTLVSPAELKRIESIVVRRRLGEPIAYLVGWREFHGHRFEVNNATLIPRPETEQLVDLAAALWMHLGQPNMLELGTGTGCIAISLAAQCGAALHITATEKSPVALQLAQRNARAILGPSHPIAWHQAQHWIDEGLAPTSLVVSNPPYIARQDPHLAQGDLRFEPRMALTDESDDGMDAVRAILGACAQWPTRPTVLIEHGACQGPDTRTLAEAFGWDYTYTLADDQGLDRILVASTRPDVVSVAQSALFQPRG